MYEYICKVVIDNQEDESFTFDGDLMALKEARGNIKDEHLIIEELYRLDGTEKRNSLN